MSNSSGDNTQSNPILSFALAAVGLLGVAGALLGTGNEQAQQSSANGEGAAVVAGELAQALPPGTAPAVGDAEPKTTQAPAAVPTADAPADAATEQGTATEAEATMQAQPQPVPEAGDATQSMDATAEAAVDEDASSTAAEPVPAPPQATPYAPAYSNPYANPWGGYGQAPAYPHQPPGYYPPQPYGYPQWAAPRAN